MTRQGPEIIPQQSESNALYGAACREVWLRYNPEACITQSARDELAIIVRDIISWAQIQPDDIKQAYQQACARICTEADKHLENARRVKNMMEIHRTIPKPPLSAQ